MFIALNYYGYLYPNANLVPINYLVILVVPFVSTIFEAITPKGFDNLTACFSAAFLYYGLMLVV